MKWSGATSVRLGEWAVRRGTGRLASLGVGSCVVIILFDPVTRVGGMVHTMLPSTSLSRDRSNPARFADSATGFLVQRMEGEGAAVRNLTARLVGGATMFANLLPRGTVSIGERNVIASRKQLQEIGIPVVGERVGGQRGRSVMLDVASGDVTVRTVGEDEQRV